MSSLRTTEPSETNSPLGEYFSAVNKTLKDLTEINVIHRIWDCDHTVWKDQSEGIVDQLGWLNVNEVIFEKTKKMLAFAKEIKDAGYNQIVLLGMGGSSLGPKVLWEVFSMDTSRTGDDTSWFKDPIVLDSTIPASVREVSDTLNFVRTLFLVSSKSGNTIETKALYRYFRSQVERANGYEQAGQSFVAVTDPETPLAQLAEHENFRCVFLNSPNLGGRYSVLSYFGMVPAVLSDINISTLLHHVERMRKRCMIETPLYDNPGAWLGAVIATLANRDRDKLTFLASPSINSFCLWVEQLIAESTGKEGKGIVPITDEPILDSNNYGNDRIFVYLRLKGDENDDLDAVINRLQKSGFPVVRLELLDRYEIGAEFFRWEFATAVAGSLLGIHPFDQPNVQQTKDESSILLPDYQLCRSDMHSESVDSLNELLTLARPGDYLAIMAYMLETQDVSEALSILRRRIAQRYRIATTLGYGPNLLHSTGQLHKGGPDTGLFLQLTLGQNRDLAVPGQKYTFGGLSDAQAWGDFRALQLKGRRVARVEMGEDVSYDIYKMADGLS